MDKRVIKLIFSTTPKKGALFFDEYESKVINSIGTDKTFRCDVFIKNPMPITEFNSIIKELCDKLKDKFNCETNLFHEDECIAKDTIDMISSVTYHIAASF